MVPERYGAYRVFEQLGKGGMATVHRAEQDTPQGVREVALKRLNPSHDPKPVKLFLDEARLLKYLHHTNIPETYDSGRVFGTYFIAMEYIKGPTLRQLLDQCAKTVGPVSQVVVLNLIGQLCDALDYAHKRTDERGRPLHIVHRDVTPANLILDHSGTLKLVDFGLAKATIATEPSTAGVLKGKLGYVAPEYTRGKLDHRADLWAVGILMYELLTGRLLFHGSQAVDTINRVRELPIPRPSLGNPRVIPIVDDIVMTALERDPKDRWPSASSMRNRLATATEQLGEQADNQKVVEWVNWALAQEPGRAALLTPVVAMPIVAQTVTLPPPPSATAEVMHPPAPQTGLSPRAIAVLAGIVLLLIVVWKIVH